MVKVRLLLNLPSAYYYWEEVWAEEMRTWGKENHFKSRERIQSCWFWMGGEGAGEGSSRVVILSFDGGGERGVLALNDHHEMLETQRRFVSTFVSFPNKGKKLNFLNLKNEILVAFK